VKIILGIFCGLMVLFAGGCAVLLLTGAGYNGMFQSLPGTIFFGGIAALNVLVLLALFGSSSKQRWPFYVLAVLDIILVLGLLAMWAGYGFQDQETNVLGALICGGFALKAALTLLTVRRI
jgi:hypothetical protein